MSDHQPIEDPYRESMRRVARVLDEQFNGILKGKHRKVGFVLLLFPFGDGEPDFNRMNYISNGGDRSEIVTAMKELIANFEGRMQPPGQA